MHKLYTDGGSRGNPGSAACAYFLFDDLHNVVDFGGEFLGTQTNNYAEYQGLKLGLKMALKSMVRYIECYLDSELVVKQLNGEYKVKDANIFKEFSEIQLLIQKFEGISFGNIRRAENKLADKLVNVILDTKSK